MYMNSQTKQTRPTTAAAATATANNFDFVDRLNADAFSIN